MKRITKNNCEIEGCIDSQKLVVYSPEKQKLFAVCSKHAREILNEWQPKFIIECKNCGCLQGKGSMAIRNINVWEDSFKKTYKTKQEAEEGEINQLLFDLLCFCSKQDRVDKIYFIEKLKDRKDILERLLAISEIRNDH